MIKINKPYKNKEWLKIQYWFLRKSAIKIGKECDVSERCIRKWMEKFKIPRRSHSEAMRGIIHEGLFKKGNVPWNKGLKGFMARETHPRWKGGKHLKRGYVYTLQPNHPHTRSKGYIREHRLVMEEKLGRYLDPEERIHHINGIKNDNRIENLMLFPNESEHQKYEHKIRVIAFSK